MATSKQNRLVMTLFALPFAGVGIGMLFFLVLPLLRDWYIAQQWVPVEAHVTSAELRSTRGSKSTTYQAVANFSYTWNNMDYTSNRVGLTRGADNIGDYQQEMAAALVSAMQNRTPVTLYINPQHPTQSLYNRELRPVMLGFYSVFVFAFGGVGIGLLWMTWRNNPDETGITDEEQPWLASKAWSSPELHATGKGSAVAMWCFALLWCAISGPANLVIAREMAKGNYAVLVILLFDAVGIGLLISAIRQTLVWKKFGDVVLTLDPHPGSIGGQVGGVIALPASPAWKQSLVRGCAFTVELICTHIHVQSRNRINIGDSNTTGRNNVQQTAVWQDIRTVQGTAEPAGGARVLFCFDVPENLPAASQASQDYHRWQLKVSAGLDGVDFAREWDIPVFATHKASTLAISEQVSAQVTTDSSLIDKTIGLKKTGKGLQLHLPAGRAAGSAAGLAFVASIFGTASAFVGHNTGLSVPFFATGCVSVIIFAIALWQLGNALSVEIIDNWMTIRRILFGVQVWQKKLSIKQVKHIGVSKGMSTSSGTQTRVYYRVIITTLQGETFIVSDGIVGYSQALQAAQRIGALQAWPVSTDG
ncbi:MAG TPA: DUF3592 domain-containing protein [Pseudomonadales bacterium]|nr:DUF3592 domain-containing protein [Pseudomonadales bacterium]